MKEIWKPVKGFEGIYEVSNFGRIFSIKRNDIMRDGRRNGNGHRFLRTRITTHGYEFVSLSKKNKVKQVHIHKLVAEAFIDNPLMKPHINHLNGIKTDNKVSNLEWCTKLENNQHARRTGLCGQNGEKSVMAKLSKENVLNIRDMYSTGDYSQQDLAKLFNVGQTTISRILRRITWRLI